MSSKKMFYYNVEKINNTGTQHALHSWLPKDEISAIIFYIHGKQSHAGWLYDTGPTISKRSIALFCLDRMGSGLSGGDRGAIYSLDELFSNYQHALQYICGQYPNVPLTLFGQSFGGCILAGLLSWDRFNVDYNSAVFCASGLGLQQQRYHNNKSSYDLRVGDIPFNIRDEDYTSDYGYLKFIKNDPYCIRGISRQAVETFMEMEELYCSKKNILENKSSAFIYPSEDPLVIYNRPLEIYSNMSGNQNTVIRFDCNKHYLEFSRHRFSLWNWLTYYVRSGGYDEYV